jgi:hypothetical protein
MNNPQYLRSQAIELRQLLDDARDDPILEPQLRERLVEAERQLEQLEREPNMLFREEPIIPPRAAIFLRGPSVHDSGGIRPGLAGDALIQYERMFVEQALHDERAAARRAGRQRRPRGAQTPRLLFTGTPRGSFGLEFTPVVTDDANIAAIHEQSLHKVANVISLVASSEPERLVDIVKAIAPRVLQPLKQFLRTLSDNGAEVRFAFHDAPGLVIAIEDVARASESLERNVNQETITIHGVFRGATRDSGVFDLRGSDDEVITGTVVDELTEEDIERIDQLTNQSCIAEVQKTTVTGLGGASTLTYVLINAREAGRQLASE